MLYVAGLVAYDGTDFHGFQYQVGVPTVQGALEDALRKFCEPRGRIVGAGRTDAGVHANGQVIATEVEWRHGPGALERAWNAHLPPSVSVRNVQVVPRSFHPRFSARWRTYRYRFVEAPSEVPGSGFMRSPLTDRFAWYVRHGLDLGAMQTAADQLVGEHDFATFGQPTQGESTVRRVTEASWRVDEHSVEPLDAYPGQRLVFTITANGFLRQMVRTITSTLVIIGQRKRPPDEIVRLLDAQDRGLSAPPAPASGLTLERVQYAEDAGFTV